MSATRPASSERPTSLPHTGLADTGTPQGIASAGFLGVVLAAAGLVVYRMNKEG